MNAAALIKKQDAILKKYGAPSGRVYKRLVTVTGGDSLIGRPGSVSHTDTELTPQPTYRRAGRSTITGDRISQKTIQVNGRVLTADQAVFIVSPTAITVADLQNPNLQFVIKTGNYTEVFQLDDYDAATFGPDGVIVQFIVFARSTSNG